MSSTDSSDPSIRKTPAGEATGPDTDAILQTEGLTKHFGGFTAIDGIDFGIDAGQLRCLIGPNGAGKSTLLKLITGRHDASEGRIFFDGQEITDVVPHARVDRGIGMKFQVPSVFESFTAAQNMRLPLQRGEEDDLGAAIDERLGRVGLRNVAETRAGELSHGEQQRLEIGMAAALDPDLLLLDEPVAGLSIEERRDVAELVTSLNDDGIAFVVIEHDIDFVARIADEVTVLHQGRIFREGPIEDIRADPDVRRIYLGGD
ncbi:ABC transporter ATP-binding protein [Halorhabdus sp. BNX81]|uniref:ABC transporter ATP-binding protein n=1 Tax=Halorhabdus sp. BNX81 TaxID=2980181 RepID=UPI0023DD19AF|nr:ABC transporter ATP-binding protein [Halorhabdus sp. BNX81]WEL22263.1 putative ABC-type transport system, ATPase component [Halorhabdus sp. BNX81]